MPTMKCIFALILTLALPALAQAPITPNLSTAEKTALQTLEKAKADAQGQFNAALQQEQVIEQEFMQSHPGWHLDGNTFAVVKNPDSRPAAKAPEPAKKP
jgi:hypothetical protein